LIIRTLNNEPLEAPSTAQSKTYPLRLLIPHILIGSIIGKGGVRIREIQEASGARLNASDACLPLSTERSLVILGVADAVHIATYYVAVTLVEQLTERFGGPAASAYATRSGGPAGVVPGGMQVVPYVPQPAGGQYGHPESFKRHHPQSTRPLPNSYGVPYGHQGPAAQAPVTQPPLHYGASPRTPYAGAGPHQPAPYGAPQPQPHAAAPQALAGAIPGQPITQQIYIPNDMVGAIIGKGGAKINEIRHLSGSVIKINEPQDNSNERLVTITGTQECNQMALYMLYSRLGRSSSGKFLVNANNPSRKREAPDLKRVCLRVWNLFQRGAHGCNQKAFCLLCLSFG
jgi:poly(rC)-binding protein 2/3/4